jgi:hypothetical protein
MTKLSGTCHCGNITFDLHTGRQAREFVPRECSCGLCRKHRASWISDPEGKAHVHYKDRNLVSSYRFGHKTADFVICARCGVLMIAHCEIDGRTRAVLNIHAMPEGMFTTLPMTTDFDEEDVPARLARRAKNWTGNVLFD